MTVDSEIIFALAGLARGHTAEALQERYGSMATAWLDEERPELLLARGLGRPLWLGRGKHELFFASTRVALQLVESYTAIKLRKSELPEGTVVAVEHGKIVAQEFFQPDRSFQAQPLPALRAPAAPGTAPPASPPPAQRLFLERTVGLEELLRNDLAMLDGNDRSLGQLALAELDRGVALDELERNSRRREEELVLAPAEPERTSQAACEQQLRAFLVEPRRRHRPVPLLQRFRR